MDEVTSDLIRAIEQKLAKVDFEQRLCCPTCGSKMKGDQLDDLAKHLGSKKPCLAGLPPEVVERLNKALPGWGFSPAEFKEAQLEGSGGSELMADAAEGSGGSLPSEPPRAPHTSVRMRSVERTAGSPARERQLVFRATTGRLSGLG